MYFKVLRDFSFISQAFFTLQEIFPGGRSPPPPQDEVSQFLSTAAILTVPVHEKPQGLRRKTGPNNFQRVSEVVILNASNLKIISKNVIKANKDISIFTNLPTTLENKRPPVQIREEVTTVYSPLDSLDVCTNSHNIYHKKIKKAVRRIYNLIC